MMPAVQIAGFLSGTLVLAFCFAKVEIHVEGSDGWAANLPTWRIEKHWLLDIFFGGRPLTGYHAWVLPFILFMFHFPAAIIGAWSWQLEARALAACFLFWIIEDFLWFVLNPAWGLRRFNRREVVWHKHWVFGMPTDYLTFGLTALGLTWWSFLGVA
jgi:hypothetical protein